MTQLLRSLLRMPASSPSNVYSGVHGHNRCSVDSSVIIVLFLGFLDDVMLARDHLNIAGFENLRFVCRTAFLCPPCAAPMSDVR